MIDRPKGAEWIPLRGYFGILQRGREEKREKERKAPLSPRDKLGIKGFFHQLKFFSLPFSSTLGSRIVVGGLSAQMTRHPSWRGQRSIQGWALKCRQSEKRTDQVPSASLRQPIGFGPHCHPPPPLWLPLWPPSGPTCMLHVTPFWLPFGRSLRSPWPHFGLYFSPPIRFKKLQSY